MAAYVKNDGECSDKDDKKWSGLLWLSQSAHKLDVGPPRHDPLRLGTTPESDLAGNENGNLECGWRVVEGKRL